MQAHIPNNELKAHPIQQPNSNFEAKILINQNKNSMFSSILSLNVTGTEKLVNKFLLDSGANISIIKISAVHDETFITTKPIQITGISPEPINTLGYTILNIVLPNNPKIKHPIKFHVVPANFPITQDGIIGEDFLSSTKALIDYGNNRAIFQLNDTKISINFITEVEKVIIPPRSEKFIKYGPVHFQEESLAILADPIVNGIFISNAIVKPQNGFVYLSVINVNENPVVITDEFNVKFNSINKYNIYTMHDNQSHNIIENRLEKLHSQLDLSHLNLEEKSSILSICRKYNNTFHLDGDILSSTNATNHTISVDPLKPPINVKPYRLAEVHKAEIKTQVDAMLAQGIVAHSDSPWNSPLLVVPKKSESDVKKWRVVVDYRRLNEITIPDSYPLPNIEDILGQLGESKYFSTLDLANGFHQILVAKEDRPKTAFSTPYGHYEFTRMPFGLRNAPPTFQRMMNVVLTGLQGIRCFVYLDDIVIYGKNLADHNEKLVEIMEALTKHNLKLQPTKCKFLHKEVAYLGHVITEEGIKPDEKKIIAIKNLLPPKNDKQVKSFLGLIGYYRKFIPKFSETACPLFRLLKKDVKFIWNEFCDEAFNKLKSLITEFPILQYPKFDKPFFVTTDASNIAIGAVLSQKNNEDEKVDLPLCFASRTLNKAECNYSTIEKEALALVWAVTHFRPYLYGRKFTIVTDHKPLVWIFNILNPSSRIMRWRIKLEEYDYVVIHKPGNLNTNADALSRLETSNINVITRSKSKKLPTIPNFQNSPEPLPQENPDTDNFSNSIDIIDEVPLTELETSSQKNPKIINLTCPDQINQILIENHNSPIGGHQGFNRTYNRIKERFHWHSMRTDIGKFIATCSICQKNKNNSITKIPMKITDTPSKPFEKVALDIVGPLPETCSGNKYILTFQDNFSKFLLAIPIMNQEAKTIADVFARKVICLFGTPTILLTDQGSNFLSEVFKKTCKLLKIKMIQTTAYHPESNGSLERSHRTLGNYLRSYVNGDQENWDTWLDFASFCHNTTPNTSTKHTPHEILFGYKPELPAAITKTIDPIYNFDDYVIELKARLQNGYEKVRQNLIESKNNNKKHYDKNSKPLLLAVGCKVLLKNMNNKTNKKVSPIYEGPYEIVEVNSPENSTIKIGNKQKLVHNNLLKYYLE